LDFSLLIHLGVIVAIYAILAVSLNLIMGVTGLFNLGLAAFYGIGAYTSAILAKAGVPWVPAMLAGVVLAGAVAFVIGIPTLRLVGDYLAVVTMGLGEIARAVFKNWLPVTRGPMGLPGIPHAALFGFKFDTPGKYLVLGIVCLGLVYLIGESLLRSPFGRVLKGIREDETAVQALGKDSYRFKMTILVIGSGMAGLAGSLFAHYITYIDPTSFVMWLTFFIFLIIMLGGLGNHLGAIAATAVFVTLREGLRFVQLPEALNPAALQQLLFGVLLIAATIFMPRGLIPERKPVYPTASAAGRPPRESAGRPKEQPHAQG
jgi:branched-chain amino acid transport system permease protein